MNTNGADGDFRSDEITTLRDQADFVITNPPFSLFNDFMAWLMKGNAKFSIVGPKSAATYTTIFPLIQSEKVWLGKGFFKNSAWFQVPEDTTVSEADKKNAEKLGLKGNFICRKDVYWFTNVHHNCTPPPMKLMTMEENLKGSKWRIIREEGYQKYDNLDALEVPYVDSIPADYTGIMGVPITFLERYNKNQFEIIGGWNGGKSGEALGATVCKYTTNGVESSGNGPIAGGRAKYYRVLIRHRTTLQM